MALLTARRTLTSILPRSFRYSFSSSLVSSRSRFAIAVFEEHCQQLVPHSITIPTRPKTTKTSHSPLNDPSPNWTDRPPKETILLDGCDYEHWLIVMEFGEVPKSSPDKMVDIYVKTLAKVVGSEEEAKKKIYSVCTTTYSGFGALISEELSHKVKGLPGVLWVLPDSYLDVPNKDYGGDLFVDGKVTPRPQYWYRRVTPRKMLMQRDRQKAIMQTIRRAQPNQNQGEPVQQFTAMGGQSSHEGPSPN